MVDLERRKEVRRSDDAPCHEHETRIRILEKSYEQLILRMDRTETTVHAIEKAIEALQSEMSNHIKVMQQHIDLSFRNHELNEMQMHKDMLVQAIKATGGFIFVLITALTTLGWFIFERMVLVP